MTRPGPKLQPYSWRGQIYMGQDAVAAAAGVGVTVVRYHLTRHGHLDFLGVGRGGNPASHNNATGKPFQGYPSRAAAAQAIGVGKSTLTEWIRDGKADRILAALMAAQARASV